MLLPALRFPCRLSQPRPIRSRSTPIAPWLTRAALPLLDRPAARYMHTSDDVSYLVPEPARRVRFGHDCEISNLLNGIIRLLVGYRNMLPGRLFRAHPRTVDQGRRCWRQPIGVQSSSTSPRARAHANICTAMTASGLRSPAITPSQIAIICWPISRSVLYRSSPHASPRYAIILWRTI